MILAESSADVAGTFLELGVVVAGLAGLARLAAWAGVPAIPFYLLAGLFFGSGIVPLSLSEAFISVGAEIGIILLLFMIGLDYTGEELGASLRTGVAAGAMDFGLNFAPGVIAGLLLGWGPLAAVVLGGVTYVSSSGIVAKALADLGRLGNRETPTVLSILVIEDLAMAVLLPLLAVLLVGNTLGAALASLVAALGAVSVVLLLALRFGDRMSRFVASESEEVLLLTTFGVTLLVAGLAQRLQVSAAVGAFLVGIALSEPVVERVRPLVRPLRDLFAALFFLFFGLQIDIRAIPAVLPVAIALGMVTAATKILTGVWAARLAGMGRRGQVRAGAALVARGEFSIVLAGLGVSAGLVPALGPVSTAYVLLLAIAGPILMRYIEPLAEKTPGLLPAKPAVRAPVAAGVPPTARGAVTGARDEGP